MQSFVKPWYFIITAIVKVYVTMEEILEVCWANFLTILPNLTMEAIIKIKPILSNFIKLLIMYPYLFKEFEFDLIIINQI